MQTSAIRHGRTVTPAIKAIMSEIDICPPQVQQRTGITVRATHGCIARMIKRAKKKKIVRYEQLYFNWAEPDSGLSA
jgi:hypothetical protein